MNPWAVVVFGTLWLAVLAGCLTGSFAHVSAANVGSANFCTNGGVKAYASAAVIIPLIYDAVIFIAISWRVGRNSYPCRSVRDGFRVRIFGDYLPAFSRMVFHDGQAYYLVTVIANLVTIIVLFISSLPCPYRLMFTVPNVAVMNMMACRVYRNTVFVVLPENLISSIVSRDLRAAIPGTESPSLWSRMKKAVSRARHRTQHRNVSGVRITVETIEHTEGDKDKNQDRVPPMA